MSPAVFKLEIRNQLRDSRIAVPTLRRDLLGKSSANTNHRVETACVSCGLDLLDTVNQRIAFAGDHL
jgi:hypothetical protein